VSTIFVEENYLLLTGLSPTHIPEYFRLDLQTIAPILVSGTQSRVERIAPVTTFKLDPARSVDVGSDLDLGAQSGDSVDDILVFLDDCNGSWL